MALPGAVPVGSTPTQIIIPNQDTRLVLLYNAGAQTVFLKFDGSATAVTTANGYPLLAGEKQAFGVGFGASGPELRFPIIGIVASGTANVVPQTAPN